jgi:hypothetical protein
MADDEAKIIAQFEEWGVEQVRLLVASGGLAQVSIPVAFKWLSDKERQARERAEAAEASQTRVAVSSRNAAWVAAVFAIVATIVGLLAWRWPLQP